MISFIISYLLIGLGVCLGIGVFSTYSSFLLSLKDFLILLVFWPVCLLIIYYINNYEN